MSSDIQGFNPFDMIEQLFNTITQDFVIMTKNLDKAFIHSNISSFLLIPFVLNIVLPKVDTGYSYVVPNFDGTTDQIPIMSHNKIVFYVSLTLIMFYLYFIEMKNKCLKEGETFDILIFLRTFLLTFGLTFGSYTLLELLMNMIVKRTFALFEDNALTYLIKGMIYYVIYNMTRNYIMITDKNKCSIDKTQ
jgi:hypothetical protein